MKITLTTIYAGPDGTARPGTVLDLPQDRAEHLLKQRCARPFDKLRDKRAPQGIVAAPRTFEP